MTTGGHVAVLCPQRRVRHKHVSLASCCPASGYEHGLFPRERLIMVLPEEILGALTDYLD